MHRLIRWYNQNTMKFWIIFAMIAFGFITIRVLDGIVAEENAQKKNSINLQSSSTGSTTTFRS